MTLIAVVYGDWMPSESGTRSHYGHGPRSICGATRKLYDDTKLRDKCHKCVKLKKAKKGQYI